MREASALLTLDKPRPIVAVTMGDAAGVGPELCLRLLANKFLHAQAVPLVIGDSDVLIRVARQLQLPFDAPQLDRAPENLSAPAVFDPPGSLAGNAVEPGRNQMICGSASLRYIEEAVKGCRAGQFAAMVTAPISKKAINLAGCIFPGHTELLGALTQCQNYAMLLYSEQVACAFVTCHQALRTVPAALTSERVIEVTRLAANALRGIRGRPPRLAMLGLNPHAGEEGLFGDEELRVIAPALEELRVSGIDIVGPLPADTAFTREALARFDGHIAMYHDQGSIPFKALAFDSGVNVTMGLPIVRTSPDHGTAFDIAWRGLARPDSFFSAYDLAVRLAGFQKKLNPSGLFRLTEA